MRSAWRKYGSLARVAFEASIAYRSAFIMHLLGYLVAAVALFSLWQAIFASSGQVGALDLADLKVYLLFGLLSNTVMGYYSESRIARKVLDGTITNDLLRPIDFQTSCLAETLGRLVADGILATLLLVGVAVLFGGVVLPSAPSTYLVVGVSLLLALLIKFGLIYLTGLVCFWTQSPLGIMWLRSAITNLFSGAIIPPVLFPPWLAALAAGLPFAGIVAAPAQLFLGHAEVGTTLALQLLWVVLLWLAGRRLWRVALRQLEINGG